MLVNEQPYAEGQLCDRPLLGYFQEQEVTSLCITLRVPSGEAFTWEMAEG